MASDPQHRSDRAAVAGTGSGHGDARGGGPRGHAAATIERPGVLPLFRRSLGDSWRALIAWSLGVAAALFLYLPLFPSLGGTAGLQQLIDQLPPELVKAIGYDQISSGAGYTESTFYGLIGLLLLTIAAISCGTAAVAGDEETGSLELTLAHGVSRTQVVLERALALLVRLSWLVLLSVAIVLALNDSAKLSIGVGNEFAAAAGLLGLTLLSGTVSMAAGAATGRRAIATAAGAGIAVLGYVFNAIANQVAGLEWLHAVSPYYWALGSSPLLNGADWGGLGLLYGLSAALIGVAVLALNRRDVLG